MKIEDRIKQECETITSIIKTQEESIAHGYLQRGELMELMGILSKSSLRLVNFNCKVEKQVEGRGRIKAVKQRIMYLKQEHAGEDLPSIPLQEEDYHLMMSDPATKWPGYGSKEEAKYNGCYLINAEKE